MTARNKSLVAIVGYLGVAGTAEVAVAQHPGSNRIAKLAGVVTASWTGPDAGGRWSDHTNWNTSPNFPNNGNGGVNYNVSIISTVGNPKVIDLDTDVTIEALFLRGTLDAQSGAASLIINGPFDWQGQLLGPGTTTANGGITDTTLSIQVGLGDGRILDNVGLATLRASFGIIIDEGAQLNNLTSGEINLQTGISTTNGGAVNNFGLLYSESSPSITGVFNNNGSVEVRSGGLRLQSTGIHDGAFHVADFTSLTFAPGNGVNDFTPTSMISGTGDLLLGQSFGAEVYNIDGTFELTGKLRTSLSTVNFLNLPTSAGFILEIRDSSLVSFDAGVPSLDDLVLSSGTFHVDGDAIITGPVRWDGTMSGPGTTTTEGLIRAVTGLTLDGRTLIADGGLRWQGSDFLLDNGAVFHNADGSTFTIDLINRRSIDTSTPVDPGRIINDGTVSMSNSPTATVKTDWEQTSTGVTNADDLSFFGNTDISGTVTVPSGSRNTITFAGPDTGATKTHWLNADSTLTAMGTVQVGDPNASGSDTINAEFAGAVDFSSPGSRLIVSGANTTLTLPGTTSSGATAARAGETLSVTALEMKKALIALFDPFVACCMPDGTCVDMPAHICVLGVEGGILNPPGSHCGDASCSAGACCLDDGTCVMLEAPLSGIDCIAVDGDYLGVFSTCDACDTGACCIGSSCTVITGSDCSQAGGLFLGLRSDCFDDKACGFAFVHQSTIGSLVADAGTLMVISPSTIEASSVSVGNLFASGACSFEGIGPLPADMTVNSAFYGFGATCNQKNLDQTITGSSELGFGVTVDLVEAAKLALDGQGQPTESSVFLGQGVEVESSDQTGGFSAKYYRCRLGETSDPATPSQIFRLPVLAEHCAFEASCPGCPGRPFVQFDAGLTLGGGCSFANMDATVHSGLTIAPDGEWTLDDSNVLTGMLDDADAKSISLKESTVAIEVLNPNGSVAFESKTLSLSNSVVRLLDADGTSELGFLSGTVTLDKPFPDDSPGGVLVIDLTSFASTATIPAGVIIAPGDSDGAPGEIGAGRFDFDDMTFATAEVELDLGSDENDVLIIDADSTSFDASLDCEIHFAPCSLIPSDKTWLVVTGNNITYPSGGDGLRTLSRKGEVTFVINQTPTGIFLDQVALAGDVNGDFAVDGADIQDFVSCMTGPSYEYVGVVCGPTDLNGDGYDDLLDYSTYQKAFGASCP